MADTSRFPEGINPTPPGGVLPTSNVPAGAMFYDANTGKWVRRTASGYEDVALVGAARMAYVDPIAGDDAQASVGGSTPYQTMQAAATAVVAAHQAAGSEFSGYIIRNIVPFAQYDEDVSVNFTGALHLGMQSIGGCMIGDFQNANWLPAVGVGRNFNCTGDFAPVNSVRPLLTFQSLLTAPWGGTTNSAYAGWRIAGSIKGDTVVGGNLELSLDDMDIFGEGETNAIDFTGTNPIVSAYIHECRIRKALNGPNFNLFKAVRTRFTGLVTVTGQSEISKCRIQGGWTSGGLAGVPPQGFFGCDMQAGSYDLGGAGLLHLDGSSNYFFKASGATLTGGTTKTIIDDLTP